MKNEKPLLRIILLCLPLLLISSAQCDSEIAPDQFAGSDGLLNEKELIEYLLVHDNKSFKDVWKAKPSSREITNEGGNLEQAKKKKSVKWELIQIKDREKSSGPYTPQQIQRKQINTKVGYAKRGLIGESILSEDNKTKYGPIRLRQKFEDWDKNIKSVGGASISYSNNRIEETGTWLSQGSLIYPIAYFEEPVDPTKEEKVYSKLALLPSITWEYHSVSSSSEADTKNLTFQLPVYYTILHNIQNNNKDISGDPTGLMSWRSEFYFSPYYLTDFDFDGAMVGANLTYEPILWISKFHTGSWVKLFKKSDIAYLFRIIPGLTYGRVLTESSYINRQEKDDMFALTTSLELRFKLFGKSSPWEVFGTYDLWYVFSGDSDGYADIFEAGSTWWFNDNVGLELKYQKGDTILTNTEIDLVTLNLQLRL